MTSGRMVPDSLTHVWQSLVDVGWSSWPLVFKARPAALQHGSLGVAV